MVGHLRRSLGSVTHAELAGRQIGEVGLILLGRLGRRAWSGGRRKLTILSSVTHQRKTPHLGRKKEDISKAPYLKVGRVGTGTVWQGRLVYPPIGCATCLKQLGLEGAGTQSHRQAAQTKIRRGGMLQDAVSVGNW